MRGHWRANGAIVYMQLGLLIRKSTRLLFFVVLSGLLSCSSASDQPRPQAHADLIFDSHPVPLVSVTPMYPESAIAQGLQGSFRLRFEIGIDGRAMNIDSPEKPPKVLLRAAVAAMEKALFHRQYRGEHLTALAVFTLP